MSYSIEIIVWLNWSGLIHEKESVAGLKIKKKLPVVSHPFTVCRVPTDLAHSFKPKLGTYAMFNVSNHYL